jgi:hypothetical protein
MSSPSAFGPLLCQLRKRAGMTQDDLAAAARLLAVPRWLIMAHSWRARGILCYIFYCNLYWKKY